MGASGTLRIESLAPGPHRLSADLLDGTTLEGTVTVGVGPAPSATECAACWTALATPGARVQAGQILEPNGARDIYRNQTFSGAQKAAAAAMLGDALEDLTVPSRGIHRHEPGD